MKKGKKKNKPNLWFVLRGAASRFSPKPGFSVPPY